MSLPRFMVLYSSTQGKYVRQRESKFSSLGVTADKVWSPHAKFEVEQSKLHPSMVHIKNSYNNKYLRLYDTNSARYILAAADEPDDDLTQWSSTLFQPELLSVSGGSVVVRLLHVQLGRYLQCVSDAGSGYIAATGTNPLESTVQFQVVDWESLVTLPKHVTLKGDNGSYLGLIEETGAALRFGIDDGGDTSIVHEVVAQSDGTFRIKNVSLGAYWRLNAGDQDNIWADDLTTTTTPSSGSVFGAIKKDDQTIALRSLGNNRLCKRYADQTRSFLRANESQITPWAQLSLAELVTSRRINDIKFQLEYGWVYDENPTVVLNPGKPVSNETDETRTFKVEIPYKDVKSCTWRATNSTLKKLGPKVEIQPDQIASIDDSSAIEMTAPFAPSYVWGETTAGNPNPVKVHEVTLPPWTVVTVKLTASRATCHVPLTYTRYDVLDEITGEEETYFMEDGEYIGTNYFNFKFEDSAPQKISKKM